jgi:hypothetical protein
MDGNVVINIGGIAIEFFSVHQAYSSDTFGNIVRLHRDKIEELKLKPHCIVKILNAKINVPQYAFLRTLEGEHNGDVEGCNWIRLDEYMRNKLGNIKPGDSVELNITEEGMCGKFNYCTNHSNPVIRYPFWLTLILGMVSIILGLIGFILGLISVF